MDDEDRISSLPDGVICHILSFLPTKYSVRTRVLSTRWEHLFTFVPILDFENSPYSNSSRSFLDFVNSVFILYNASRMEKFRFQFSNFRHPNKHCLIVPWISAAISLHVKEIEVSIDFGVHPTLPRQLFSCKTLTKLTLRGKVNVLLPRSACLPCLRICDFLSVCFDGDSAWRFFLSCPVLEHLRLMGCRVGEGVEALCIDVPTLKQLTVSEGLCDYQIVFNLPNLLSFDYEGPAEHEFSGLETLKSLVESSICYAPEFRDNGVVLNLVRASCHVHSFRLSCDVMERFADGDDYVDQNKFSLPQHVPACVSLHLREVIFWFTTGMDYDRKLINYFLKHANNLEKMIIHSNSIWNEQFEISSTTCEIVFRVVIDTEDV